MKYLILLIALIGTLAAYAVADETQDHIHAARNAADVARAEAYADDDTELHMHALDAHRLLVMANTAWSRYLTALASPPDAPPEEPPVIESPVEDSRGWTIPDDAEIRVIGPGVTQIEVRRLNAPDGKWIVYDLSNATDLQWVHVGYNSSGLAFVGSPDGSTVIDNKHANGEVIRIVGQNISRIKLIDLTLTGSHTGIVAQTFGEGEDMRDVHLLRCKIVRNYTVDRGGHSQGIYAGGVWHLTIEECEFDTNGYTADDLRTATMFNHNMYLSSIRHGRIVNNIIRNAASFGIKVEASTAGGTSDLLIQGNLIEECPNGITVGSNAGVSQACTDVRILDNKIINIGGRQHYHGLRELVDDDGEPLLNTDTGLPLTREVWITQGFGLHFSHGTGEVRGNEFSALRIVRPAIIVDAGQVVEVAGNDISQWERN